ncbi:MAG: hypothetical protein U0V73_04655 [Acidimicrobiia bacterium]
MPPDSVLESLDRTDLAVLVREYLLAGHLVDRAGMPQVIGRLGREGMRDVAIDEWMGASPIYTRRMQRVLGYSGDTVETMFKGLQFDIGSPPQFLDFRFKIDGRNRGEFWLDSCGALLDCEPLGDEFVLTMCHDIEDPTFDATAAAVNPRARVRPIHRPPRDPADRVPHCHWTVTIDPLAEPVGEPEPALRLAESLAASLPLASADGGAHAIYGADGAPAPDDGRTDYAGPLEADLDLARFSARTLRAVADEVCLQGQLLAMSFVAALETREGPEVASVIGRQQCTGIAGVAADRLRRAFGVTAGLDGLARVLALHPMFRPRRYVDVATAREGDALLVELRPCVALSEPREVNWAKLLAGGFAEPIAAIANAVDPTARVEATPAEGGAVAAWRVTTGHEPAAEAAEVQVTRFSTGTDFVFEDR